MGDLRRDIVCGQRSASKVFPQPRDEAQMNLGALLTKIGEHAALAEPRNSGAPLNGCGDIGILGKAAHHREVYRFGCGGELGAIRRSGKIGDKRFEAIKPWFGIAPEQPGYRRKTVLLDGIDFIIGEFGVMTFRACQRAESSIAVMPPSAPRDLRHFRRGQAALALAIVF